jgi:hypothetical protein
MLAWALARGIHRDTVRACLLGLHYIDPNGSGHHFLLGQAALILASLEIRSPSRRTQVQQRGILVERRHKLEKHYNKAEMYLLDDG